MKKLATIFILTYYAFSIYCLPQGNFSAMLQLHDMYNHCKATEDKDLTVIEFFTDHLVDCDYLFDQGDSNEKPHAPYQFHNLQQQVLFNTVPLKVDFNKVIFQNNRPVIYKDGFCNSDYVADILQPPIV